jgi:hypothetical protein
MSIDKPWATSLMWTPSPRAPAEQISRAWAASCSVTDVLSVSQSSGDDS